MTDGINLTTMNRCDLTVLLTIMILLPPSTRVASQEWHMMTMYKTMIMMMMIAIKMKTQKNVLEYPLRPHKPVENLVGFPP